MSENTQGISTSSLALDRPRAGSGVAAPFAACVGFYFSFRLFFPLLAVRVFGQDAQRGVVLSLTLNYLLLVLAVIDSVGTTPSEIGSPLHWPSFRWALLFLGFSGVSLSWSATASLSAAAAFWCAMAADTAIVIILLRNGAVEAVVNSLMSGYIWGSCAIAVIAWLLPAQSDLRLGDEELLGPNQIGWACAFAFFLAQYLIRRGSGNWNIPALLLAITLLRSLSKTTIIAFLIGQAYILVRDRSIGRRAKLLRLGSAVLVLFIFWRLLSDYYTVYTNAGNQVETLTGRFGIWLYFLGEAVQKPWIGHGFHSVWKIIPPFNEFEARHAHNEFIQQFYSYGIAGVAIVIAVYGSIWRQLRRISNPSLRTFFLGMLLFVIVRCTADTETFDLSLPVWFIAMMGALLQQLRNHSEVPA
jgi:exopolysaccharide production protein ExoQ